MVVTTAVRLRVDLNVNGVDNTGWPSPPSWNMNGHGELHVGSSKFLCGQYISERSSFSLVKVGPFFCRF